MYAGSTYGKEDDTMLTSPGGSREFTHIYGTSWSVSCLMGVRLACWRKKAIVVERGFPGRSRPGTFPFSCCGGAALICTDALESDVSMKLWTRGVAFAAGSLCRFTDTLFVGLHVCGRCESLR